MDVSKQIADPVKFNYKKNRPVSVEIKDGMVMVKLANGRVLQTPLQRHPWLAKASSEQRANVELGVFSVDWPDLDEGLDIEWMRQEDSGSNKGSIDHTVQSNRARKSVAFHVVPAGTAWAVKPAGSERGAEVYKTQEQAINAARYLAQKQSSGIVIHGADGRIKSFEKGDTINTHVVNPVRRRAAE